MSMETIENITQITVKFYKDSGKLYTVEVFITNFDPFETQKIIDFINKKVKWNLSYTFIAQKDELYNEYLVIK